MYLETEGIVITRKIFREYDEKVTFFTRELGKIFCYAYGTRSARSHRRHLLANLDWLIIGLEKKKDRYILKSLQKKISNRFEIKADHFMTFGHLLKKIDNLLPLHQEENSIYELLKRMTAPPIKDADFIFQDFYFSYATLHLLGVFPYVYLEDNSRQEKNHAWRQQISLSLSRELEEAIFCYDYEKKTYRQQATKLVEPKAMSITTDVNHREVELSRCHQPSSTRMSTTTNNNRYAKLPNLDGRALAILIFFGNSFKTEMIFFNELYRYCREKLHDFKMLADLISFGDKLLALY